jgi:hypothetical protein
VLIQAEFDMEVLTGQFAVTFDKLNWITKKDVLLQSTKNFMKPR